MDERFCDVGPVRLCYETFGDPSRPTVLLIMGLGTQMVAWHEDFCATLAQRGFHVVRFDNRDAGRSSQMAQLPPPTLAQLLRRSAGAARYGLGDMARDAVGLLDHLGVDSAHVVGASMGGMIAQTMAIEHPSRVRSLTSVMSNTGSLFSGQPALRLYPIFLRRPASDREAWIEETVKLYELIGGTGFARDEEGLREIIALSYDRGHDAEGAGRQLAAILADRGRERRLRTLRVPTLVIHGTADRLVRPSGGRATARAIPGAKLLMIDGMGHDLPRGAWPRIVGAIAQLAERADGERSSSIAA